VELDRIRNKHDRILQPDFNPIEEDLILHDLSDFEEAEKAEQVKVLNLVPRLPNPHIEPTYMNGTNPHDLELKMNTHKVEQVKKMHGNLIGLGKFNGSEEVSGSLSIYAKYLFEFTS
jgi:hypothetical protein